MSIIKSQNRKYVVFSNNIDAIRIFIEPYLNMSYEGICTRMTYTVQVSYDGCHFIDMGNYKTEQEAATVMDAIIGHIKKDEDYDISMEVRFYEEE